MHSIQPNVGRVPPHFRSPVWFGSPGRRPPCLRKQILNAVGLPRKERAAVRRLKLACELVEYGTISIEDAEDLSGSGQRGAQLDPPFDRGRTATTTLLEAADEDVLVKVTRWTSVAQQGKEDVDVGLPLQVNHTARRRIAKIGSQAVQ